MTTAIALDDNMVWEAGTATAPDGTRLHVVIDRTHGNAIVASSGKVHADPEHDALNAYHAQLIAGIPASSAVLARALQLLNDLVAQPPVPATRMKARKAARELLLAVSVVGATDTSH